MRRRSPSFLFLLLSATGLFVPMAAHELNVSVRLAAPAAILQATYANSDPAPFAKIQVFSPAKQEFQAGNTDRRGYFSFVPEGAGEWHVIVDDELGHRQDVAVAVPEAFLAANPSTGPAGANVPASRWERAALGLALLIGLTGFWYGYRARKSD